MRIDELHLENFKKFAVQEIDLHPNFTLLVGENGAGKTTVLDALAVAAGVWLVDPPDSTLISSGRNILPSEIRLEPQTKGDRIQFQERRPVIVRAKGRIGEHDDVSWTRQIRPDGVRTSNADAKSVLAYIMDLYLRDGEGENVLCPVLAYYGAGRAWLPSNERVPKSKTNGPARRWAAFYDCFNERIRSAELHKWFSRETTERGNRGGKWRPGFEVVRRAVLRCVPDADEVWFDTDRDQIVLSIGGNAQPFDNLSAGQRMMLALIADLAIKAVTQNAFLLPPDELGAEDDPLPRVLKLTPGMVLIDEVDVHLHPIWQRRIAKDLKGTFPAIQFVCTSHSPQLIGELQPDEIRLMHDNDFSQPASSFGMDSNWVVEVLMGGSKCNAQVKDRLARVFQLTKDRNLAEAEREVLLLRGEIGNSDELQRAVSMVERIKLLGK
jgi:predicted ATP-binding protein involved in virulence